MRISNMERMRSLAARIPARAYERKETAAAVPGAGEMKTLRDEIMSTVAEYKTWSKQYVDDLIAKGAVSSEVKEHFEKIALRMDDLEARMKRPGGQDAGAPLSKTIGQLFVASEELKTYKQRGWHKGGVAMRFTDWFDQSVLPQTKTVIQTSTIGTSGVGMPQALRVPGILTPGQRELRIRDLLRVTPITQNSVEFLKESGFTNAASPQVEGEAKAEAAFTFTLESERVRTIAHWIPATRQVLDDMNQLMSYIDTRLRYGLMQKEEDEILSGDGTGEHLNGIITQATAYDTARDVSGDSHLDTISHAITQARVAEYPVDGIVLHPDDVEVVRLIKEDATNNQGQYIYGDPATGVPRGVWGRPIVETTAITSGTFLVGAFALGAELFDRQEATVDVSTEHDDFFVKNKVAIRAEERLVLAVYRPESFVYGTF